MNNEIFSRNIMCWGEETQTTLKSKHVAIFGLGGVGGYTADALARAGVGELTLVDFDDVSATNINRQLVALNSTVGMKKTELFKQRLLDINPDLKLNVFDKFYDEKINDEVFKSRVDAVVDAIDTMRAKVDLLVYCKKNNIPVFSSVGAGNRFDPTQLYIADISECEKPNCGFVKNLLRNLKKCNITEGITCVFSREKPKKPVTKEFGLIETGENTIKKFSPSSTPCVPPVAGYFLAFSVLKTIIKNVDKK